MKNSLNDIILSITEKPGIIDDIPNLGIYFYQGILHISYYYLFVIKEYSITSSVSFLTTLFINRKEISMLLGWDTSLFENALYTFISDLDDQLVPLFINELTTNGVVLPIENIVYHNNPTM